MEFKEFNNLVEKYYPLNKDKSRYLILFKDGTSKFYKCFKRGKEKYLIAK